MLTLEDIYFSERNKKIALDLMDVLTEKQRYVITERFFNGVSYKEIKVLFTEQCFGDLSVVTKVLYGLMLKT